MKVACSFDRSIFERSLIRREQAFEQHRRKGLFVSSSIEPNVPVTVRHRTPPVCHEMAKTVGIYIFKLKHLNI